MEIFDKMTHFHRTGQMQLTIAPLLNDRVYELRNLKVVAANRMYNHTDMPVELTVTQAH